jgi:hypothetical protein
MFEDEARPLYKLCRQLNLERISYEDYKKHLNNAAITAWRTVLTDDVIKGITDLTECHPYYMNKFCDVVWSENKKAPNIEDISRAWQLFLGEEKGDLFRELSLLSAGQKKVLSIIATGTILELSGKESANKLNMSPSSISAALRGLEDKDVIDRKNQQYKIINPVLKAYIKANVDCDA